MTAQEATDIPDAQPWEGFRDINREMGGRDGYGDPPYAEVPDDVIGEAFEFADEKVSFLPDKNAGKALEYEKQVKGLLNAFMQLRMTTTAGLPDAAAVIEHGTRLSKAAGRLAAEDERAAKIIDMLTVPSNPYFMFAMAAFSFGGQLARNHDQQLSAIPGNWRQRRAVRKAEKAQGVQVPVRVTVPLTGGRLKIRVPARVKVSLRFLMSQSVEPAALAEAVFTNEKVLKELKKRGISVPGQ